MSPFHAFFFDTYNVSQGFLHQKQPLFFPHDQFPPFFLTLYLGHLCSLCFAPCTQMYEFTTSSGLYLQRLIYRKIISLFRDLSVLLCCISRPYTDISRSRAKLDDLSHSVHQGHSRFRWVRDSQETSRIGAIYDDLSYKSYYYLWLLKRIKAQCKFVDLLYERLVLRQKHRSLDRRLNLLHCRSREAFWILLSCLFK